jgi:hypothetical protein
VATWNRGADRNKGYTSSEIVGRSFSQLFLPEDVAKGISGSVAGKWPDVQDQPPPVQLPEEVIAASAAWSPKSAVLGEAPHPGLVASQSSYRAPADHPRQCHPFRNGNDAPRRSSLGVLNPLGSVRRLPIAMGTKNGLPPLDPSLFIGQHCARNGAGSIGPPATVFATV